MFEEKIPIERLGQKVGYVFAYLIFTTFLYILLGILNMMPGSWSYLHIMGLSLGVVLFEITIRRLLI